MSTRLYNVMNKLVSRLENFDETIKNWMNTNHKWRYVGQATGKGTAHAISLPNDDNWCEVFVKLLLPSNNNYSYVFHLPRIALTDLSNDGKNVMNGAYINAYDNAEPIVAFETNQVYVVASYFAGTEQGDNATIRVYVR